MKMNKMSIVVLLVTLSLLMGPVSAKTINVDSSMTNVQIQGNITAASSGDTINFAPGNYNGVSLTINKALNMIGNGANLIGSGSSIMTISNTNGLNISGFNININSTACDGITGSSVVSCQIKNNTITNGGDAINIYSMYKDLTIDNNTITNMVSNFGDAISLVNHDLNLETTTTSRVTNNVINNAVFGIFLGGNFNGTVSGNTITNTQYGMNITGKHNASLGSLNANITNNVISGIAMEAPHIVYLNLNGNTINGLGSTGYSILNTTYNGIAYYHKDGTISVTNNNFTAPVFDQFRSDSDTWENNLLNGEEYSKW